MAIFPEIGNALVLRSTALFSRTLRQCNSEPPQRVLSPPALEIFTESCGSFANDRNKRTLSLSLSSAFSGKEDQYAASTIKATSTALPKLDESPLGLNLYADGKRLIAPIPLLTKEHNQVVRKFHASGCNYFKTRSGTTLIGIMLPNGIVIGSDGRGTKGRKGIDSHPRIVGDNFDKVIDLGKNVFCAVSGEINAIASLIHHIRANTVFNPREHCVESLAREAFSYLQQCGGAVSVLIAGVDSVRPCLWCVSSVKSHNGQYRITHKDVKVWKACGSGSEAAGDFLELVVKENVSFAGAFTACKIGLLLGALMDPCSGGVLLVQHLRLDGIHLLLKTNALDLYRECHRPFIDLQEKSVLLIFKIESVSVQEIRNWAEGMGNGMINSLEEIGHPLVELMGGFYTHEVAFKSKRAASLALEGAQRVPVRPVFARKIKGIRSFMLNGSLIHVCLARKVDLENLVIVMPPTKPIL